MDSFLDLWCLEPRKDCRIDKSAMVLVLQHNTAVLPSPKNSELFAGTQLCYSPFQNLELFAGTQGNSSGFCTGSGTLIFVMLHLDLSFTALLFESLWQTHERHDKVGSGISVLVTVGICQAPVSLGDCETDY